MKRLVKLLALVLLLVVGLGIAGFVLVPPAARTALDEGSRHAFGVPSTLGGVNASPGLASTSVGFSEFVLSSPEGFEEPLLSIGRFQVGVGTKSLVGNVKEIGTLTLEDVELTLTQDGTSNNLVPVLQHVLAGRGDAPEPRETEAPSGGDSGESSPGPRLRIGTVRVARVAARFQLRGLPGVEPYDQRFEIPAYEEDWSEFTGEEGRTVSEVAGEFLRRLEERAMDGAEGIVPPETLGALRMTFEGGLEGGIDAATEALQGELDAQRDALEDKARKEAESALEGLFDKGGR